jgi:hypothetical protein
MNEEKKTEKQTSKLEGPKAIDALFDAFQEEGVDKSKVVIDLLTKINKLETEVEVLKDLVSRAISVKPTTLKD